MTERLTVRPMMTLSWVQLVSNCLCHTHMANSDTGLARSLLLHFCLVASLASVARRASAQVTYAFQPFVGYYRPLGHFDPAAF